MYWNIFGVFRFGLRFGFFRFGFFRFGFFRFGFFRFCFFRIKRLFWFIFILLQRFRLIFFIPKDRISMVKLKEFNLLFILFNNNLLLFKHFLLHHCIIISFDMILLILHHLVWYHSKWFIRIHNFWKITFSFLQRSKLILYRSLYRRSFFILKWCWLRILGLYFLGSFFWSWSIHSQFVNFVKNSLPLSL